MESLIRMPIMVGLSLVSFERKNITHDKVEHKTKHWLFRCLKSTLRMHDCWCIRFTFTGVRFRHLLFIAVRSCTILQNNCIICAVISFSKLHYIVLLQCGAIRFVAVSISIYLSPSRSLSPSISFHASIYASIKNEISLSITRSLLNLRKILRLV